MKRKLISLLVFSLVALIAGGSIAMASSGKLTEIEQKWFDFRKAVAERQVKDGILTRQQADSMIAELEKRLVTDGDTVYEKFAKKFSLDGSGKREKGKEGAIMRLYAQVTDRTPEQISSLCDKDKIGIWDLAKKEGHTDQLKSALLTMATDNLDRKVGEGILTKQQRDEALKKIADTLNGPNPNLAEFGFHRHSGF